MISIRSLCLAMPVSLAVLLILSACTATEPTVIEKLDELTAVTVTYCRTPLVMSADTPLNREARRDYVQVGVIEVNRMGALQYYLWLGISEVNPGTSADTHPEGYEAIVFTANNESFGVDVAGWTAAVIGTSEPVYQKLFQDSADAYYEVTLEQIQLLLDSDSLKLQTSGSTPKEFVSWYSQTTFEGDLAEFFRAVKQ